MSEHFHIPGSWDPLASAFGRMLGRMEADRLRMEATYYVLAVTAVFGFLVLVFVGWAWINLEGPPAEAVANRYWLFQSLGFIGVMTLLLAGWRRGADVVVTDQGIRVTSSRADELRIAYPDVDEVDTVSRQRYHEHFRLYAKTRVVSGKPPSDFVMVRTKSFPLFLGIRAEEQALFMNCVEAGLQARPRTEHRVA